MSITSLAWTPVRPRAIPPPEPEHAAQFLRWRLRTTMEAREIRAISTRLGFWTSMARIPA